MLNVFEKADCRPSRADWYRISVGILKENNIL